MMEHEPITSNIEDVDAVVDKILQAIEELLPIHGIHALSAALCIVSELDERLKDGFCLHIDDRKIIMAPTVPPQATIQ